jgi:DNA mismatch repair protein MutS2
VPFQVSDAVLERLEWPALVTKLAAHLRTAAARARFASDPTAARSLFESDPDAARERLAETSEARGLLDAGRVPPLPAGADLGEALARLRRGGALAAQELLALGSLLAGLHELGRFLAARSDEAPRLAGHAALLPDLRGLAGAIASAISDEGQVRDDASGELREARREARALSGELTRRVEALLRDPDVASSLSDAYYTLRNDRFVLPVRADARRRVPGIVHDASASGTTLFVEPEAMVDANNRLKQAELTAEREVQRVLRGLCERAAGRLDEILAGLDRLAALDLAFARGHLSRELDAVEPEVGDAGVFRLPALRHALIAADEVVPNDLALGESFRVLVISGPNAGGKTVAAKALALAALGARAGLHVCAAPGARVDRVDAVLADIGDAQSLRDHLSTFSAHLANLAAIVREASSRSLVVLDEVGVGTDPGEGAALAQAVLEALAERGARVVTTTHYNLLKEIAALDARFENACVELDPRTFAPTFRLRLGAPGASSAATLAERMGLPAPIVARARALLAGGPRELDRLLVELAASRAELDRERAEARRARDEAEAARDEHRRRADELRERRQRLLHRMREEARELFRDAQARVAGAIHDLQRGGGAPAAAHARERLLAAEAELEARLAEPEPVAPPAEPGGAVDWSRARPGDAVRVRGRGAGTLVSLPDRRGRVTVQLGAARVVLPARELVAEATPPRAAVPPAPVRVERAEETDEAPGGATAECDLRGLRVDEALDRVDAALDRALAAGRARVRLVHGHGTGVLREAVRAHLAKAPHVRSHAPGADHEGGNGVTVAVLD